MESTEIRGGSSAYANAALDGSSGGIAQDSRAAGINTVAASTGTELVVRSGDAGISVGVVLHSHPEACV